MADDGFDELFKEAADAWFAEEFDYDNHKDSIKKARQRMLNLDAFKEMKAYLSSEQNIRECEPFEQLNEKFTALAKQYDGSFDELYRDIEARTCRREYAKGGGSLHRGFYSPRASDLVVGNSKRGRLLKRAPKDNRPTYEYLFDSNDDLICVYGFGDRFGSWWLYDTELLIYEPDRVLGLDFSTYEGQNLDFISECRYDGNGLLMRYEGAVCSLAYLGEECLEIQVEEFDYTDGLLQVLHIYDYNPAWPLLNHYKYVFNRDEDGYLSTYTVEDKSGVFSNLRKRYPDTGLPTYKVLARRK